MAQNTNTSLSLANLIDILNKAQSIDRRYGVYDTEADALTAMAQYGLDGRLVAVYTDKANGVCKLYKYNEVHHRLDSVTESDNTKLDKIWADIEEQTTTNLNDTLVVNSGGALRKTTVAKLLANVPDTNIFLTPPELPLVGEPNRIYIIQKEVPEAGNEYNEYIWINDDWELIGTLSINLDDYFTKTQINDLLNNKVDKEPGKQLSDENFSLEEKSKLASIEEGAQVNVIPDWGADTDNPRRIDNKPTRVSQFINDGDKTSPFATLKDIYRTNIVLNYGIVNIEGAYQYDLWADRYIINNVLYTEMLTGSVTLSNPHPTLDRIDKIVIHSDGEFRVKEGVPAENPVSPQVDPQTEVEVRFILVKGGSTEPETDVYRVFDENEGSPNEWSITLHQGNIDIDNVEYASRGTKSIKFNVDFNVSRIRFSPEEPIPFEDFSELLLDVRAEDDNNLFILQINDVFIEQLAHGVRGFEADGNFHTVSFRKDEILTMFEQYGAPTDEGINEIHLWQDNNTHNYWVDNIRIVKDDSGGSPQPVRIQRTSEIPVNDGATGVSRYVEVSELGTMSFENADDYYTKSQVDGILPEETAFSVYNQYSEVEVNTTSQTSIITADTGAKSIAVMTEGASYIGSIYGIYNWDANNQNINIRMGIGNRANIINETVNTQDYTGDMPVKIDYTINFFADGFARITVFIQVADISTVVVAENSSVINTGNELDIDVVLTAGTLKTYSSYLHKHVQ